jgi:hypothetical protein
MLIYVDMDLITEINMLICVDIHHASCMSFVTDFFSTMHYGRCTVLLMKLKCMGSNWLGKRTFFMGKKNNFPGSESVYSLLHNR